MDVRDLMKPGALVLGIAAAGAVGFAAGFVVARDPQVLRRFARAVAGGVERVTGALAESREELADLWAEVRAEAREDVEDQAFAAAAAATVATASARAAEPSPDDAVDSADSGVAESGTAPRKRRSGRRTTRSPRGARKGTATMQ